MLTPKIKTVANYPVLPNPFLNNMLQLPSFGPLAVTP